MTTPVINTLTAVPDLCGHDVAAEPITDESDNCEHWADLIVTEELNNDPKKYFECNLCNYRCFEEEPLLKHMIRKHSYMEKGFLICGFCQFRYPDEYYLKRHLHKHMPEKTAVDDCWKTKFLKERHYEVTRKPNKKFTEYQEAILESAYEVRKKLTQKNLIQLANQLRVGVARVEKWYNKKNHWRAKHSSRKKSSNS